MTAKLLIEVKGGQITNLWAVDQHDLLTVAILDHDQVALTGDAYWQLLSPFWYMMQAEHVAHLGVEP